MSNLKKNGQQMNSLRDHWSKWHGSEEESETDSGNKEEPESCLET